MTEVDEAPPGLEAPAPSDPPRVELRVAVVVVAVAVVLALVVVGAVIRLQEPSLASGPAVAAPPPPTPADPYVLGVDGRKVTYQELRVTLPGEPFTCDTSAAAAPPEFRSLVRCTAVVHAGFSGTRDWTDEVGVAVPSAEAVTGLGVKNAAGSVFDSILAGSYSASVNPRVTGKTSIAVDDVAPSGQAWAVYADVHVKAAGLATTSDRLLVIAIRLASSRTVVYFSARPNDADAATKTAARSSLLTLSAYR